MGSVWLLCSSRALGGLAVAYAAYWFAFPLEGGERTSCWPSLHPKQSAVRTLSGALLARFGVRSPSIAELLRIMAPSAAEQERRDEAAVVAQAFGAKVGRRSRTRDDARRLLWALDVTDLLEAEAAEASAAGAGGGTVSAVGVPELARLLLAEEGGGGGGGGGGGAGAGAGAGASATLVPAEMRWTREQGEATLDAMFARRAAFGEGDAAASAATERTKEMWKLKFGLERWAAKPPPGYRAPEIVLDRKAHDGTEAMRRASRERGAPGSAGRRSRLERVGEAEAKRLAADAGDAEALGSKASQPAAATPPAEPVDV